MIITLLTIWIVLVTALAVLKYNKDFKKDMEQNDYEG